MQELNLVLGTLSGARECRKGSGGCGRGEVVGVKGPRREDLLRKAVDLDTGLRGQTLGFPKPDHRLSGQAGLWNCCFAYGTRGPHNQSCPGQVSSEGGL